MANILIIEDQLQLCNLYRSVFRQFDHEAVFATNGEAGLEAAQQQRPDLIILDLLLPGMPGTEVAHNLRELGIIPDVPLIITTALDELDPRVLSVSMEASAVLHKPFSVTSIVDTLSQVLSSHPQKTLPSSVPLP